MRMITIILSTTMVLLLSHAALAAEGTCTCTDIKKTVGVACSGSWSEDTDFDYADNYGVNPDYNSYSHYYTSTLNDKTVVSCIVNVDLEDAPTQDMYCVNRFEDDTCDTYCRSQMMSTKYAEELSATQKNIECINYFSNQCIGSIKLFGKKQHVNSHCSNPDIEVIY